MNSWRLFMRWTIFTDEEAQSSEAFPAAVYRYHCGGRISHRGTCLFPAHADPMIPETPEDFRRYERRSSLVALLLLIVIVAAVVWAALSKA